MMLKEKPKTIKRFKVFLDGVDVTNICRVIYPEEDAIHVLEPNGEIVRKKGNLSISLVDVDIENLPIATRPYTLVSIEVRSFKRDE